MATRARSTRRSALETALEGLQRPLDGAFLIDVPDSAIVERAVGRLLCNSCGAIYHLQFKPPQVAGFLRHLQGNPLSVREDDTPSTVRHRLTVIIASRPSADFL
jgi:adenylate kinase